MKTKPNPTPKHGKWGYVNQSCPSYYECFNRAVSYKWVFWTCSKCPNKTKKPLLR